jgi:diacylglycerol O-acyltransferase
MEQELENQPTWQAEEIPSALRLLWDALVDHIKYDVRNLPAVLGILWRGTRKLVSYAKSNPAPTLVRLRSGLPRVRWNYALSPKRSLHTARLSVTGMRELKSSPGGTINDVVLAVVAGSLRQFLNDHDELRQRPLLASIAVAAYEGDSTRHSGNRIASITTLLHLGMGKPSYGLFLQYLPPVLLRWNNQRNDRLRKANRADYLPLTKLCVPHVPGRLSELFDGVNRVSDFYSIGPLLEGVGLNITVWSGFLNNPQRCRIEFGTALITEVNHSVDK